MLVDRHSRRDLLIASSVVRTASLLLITGTVAAGGPIGVVLVLAAVEGIAATLFRPGQAALLPLLADTPRQLAAVNVFANVLENVAFLIGAIAGGLLMAGPGAGWAFGVTAVSMGLAAALLCAVPRDAVPAHRERQAGASVVAESLGGLRQVWAEPRLRLVVGVLAVTTTVEGAADVLVVVVAFDLLDVGEAGLGWLNAAWAVGGLVGGVLVAVLLGGGRLAAGLASGCILAGAAIAGLASWTEIAPALVLLVLLGVGYTLIEVAGETLLQRLAPDDVLGRVFGVVEGTYVATTAAGSILAPVAIAAIGLEGALVARRRLPAGARPRAVAAARPPRGRGADSRARVRPPAPHPDLRAAAAGHAGDARDAHGERAGRRRAAASSGRAIPACASSSWRTGRSS